MGALFPSSHPKTYILGVRGLIADSKLPIGVTASLYVRAESINQKA